MCTLATRSSKTQSISTRQEWGL